MKRSGYTIASPVSPTGKRECRELLLPADPSEERIGRYLAGSDMFLWRDDTGRVSAKL